MRIKRKDNGRRALWMRRQCPTWRTIYWRLTSAFDACMLWHERRTEARHQQLLLFSFSPVRWMMWWCDGNMLCKCCAEALFSNGIGYGWGFSPVISHVWCTHVMEATRGQRESERVKSQKGIYDAALRSAIQILSANDKITSCMHYSVCFNDYEYTNHIEHEHSTLFEWK